MKVVLGIDGGGTKTHAVILDERLNVLGEGFGPSCNFDDLGVERATLHLGQAVERAREAAGLAHGPFDAAFLGMGGVVSAHDRELARGMAAALRLAPPERVGVDHDARPALSGGLSGRPGLVQIAGTGAATFGVNARGERASASGMGPMVSDEGSGHWVGIESIRAAVRSADGRGPASSLQERVRVALDIADYSELLHRLHVVGLPRSEVAALAPLAVEAAQAGDAAAVGILAGAAQEIALSIATVARRLGWGGGEACEVVMVGGLFRGGEAVLAPLRAALAERQPGARLVWPEQNPAVGAGRLALALLGGRGP